MGQREYSRSHVTVSKGESLTVTSMASLTDAEQRGDRRIGDRHQAHVAGTRSDGARLCGHWLACLLETLTSRHYGTNEPIAGDFSTPAGLLPLPRWGHSLPACREGRAPSGPQYRPSRGRGARADPLRGSHNGMETAVSPGTFESSPGRFAL